MPDRPLNLRDWQVRAALDGRLSVVVVPAKEQPAPSVGAEFSTHWHWRSKSGVYLGAVTLPLIVGGRYWVREAWAKTAVAPIVETIDNPWAVFRVGDNRCDYGGPWKSSAIMRRHDSRLTLIPTSVRVCRVQDVTRDEATAAGVTKVRDACHVIRGFDYDLAGLCHTSPVTPFAKMWNHQYGPGSWDANPWACIATVDVHHRNIDSMEG